MALGSGTAEHLVGGERTEMLSHLVDGRVALDRDGHVVRLRLAETPELVGQDRVRHPAGERPPAHLAVRVPDQGGRVGADPGELLPQLADPGGGPPRPVRLARHPRPGSPGSPGRPGSPGTAPRPASGTVPALLGRLDVGDPPPPVQVGRPPAATGQQEDRRPAVPLEEGRFVDGPQLLAAGQVTLKSGGDVKTESSSMKFLPPVLRLALGGEGEDALVAPEDPGGDHGVHERRDDGPVHLREGGDRLQPAPPTRTGRSPAPGGTSAISCWARMWYGSGGACTGST